jgi:hypothetical protein
MYPNHRGLERRWALLAAVLLAPAAWAHDADVIYVRLTDAAAGELDENVTLTAGTLSQLAPIDADGDGALSQSDLDARTDALRAGVWDQMPLEAQTPCARRAEKAVLRDGFVELAARFSCGPGALNQEFRILRGLTSNYRVVLGRQLEGDSGRTFAQGNVQRLLIRPRAADAVPASGFAQGLLWIAHSFATSGVWLLSLLLASSLLDAAKRTALLLLGAAAIAAFGWSPSPLLPTALIAGVGTASTLALLARGKEQWPLVGLAVLSVGEGLSMPAGVTIGFHLGRLTTLLVLGSIAVLLNRILQARPALRRTTIAFGCCLTLAALGFSLIQTARAF